MVRRTGTNASGTKAMPGTAVCTVAALVALAACTSPGSGSSPAHVGTHGNEAVVLHRLVECVRAHGVPGFPEGSINSQGVVSFPSSAPRVPDSAINACRPIFDQLPPQPTSSPPVPQPVFQKLLSFARCMRSHGVTDWPDPTPAGLFLLDARLVAAGKPGSYRQMQACERANPGILGHFSIAAARG
jgi:hypothetical protein